MVPLSANDSPAPREKVLDLVERTWLPAHARGDQNAFADLIRTHGALVRAFLVRYGVPEEARDDLFQDIFLKVHLAAASYRPDQPLRPWLITVAINCIRNARRTRSRVPQMIPLEPEHAPAPAQRGADADALLSWVHRQIRTLPDAQREALALFALSGLTMREIAQIMQIPENTAKTHLRRARLALAERLASDAGGPS